MTVNVGSPDLISPRTYQVYINATDGESSALTNAVINITKLFSFEISCDEPEKVQDGTGATYLTSTFTIKAISTTSMSSLQTLEGRGWFIQGGTPGSQYRIRYSQVLQGNVLQYIPASRQFYVPSNRFTRFRYFCTNDLSDRCCSCHIQFHCYFNDREPGPPGDMIDGVISISTISNCRDS